MAAQDKLVQICGPSNYQAISSLQISICCTLLSQFIPSPIMQQCFNSTFSLCCSSLWLLSHKTRISNTASLLPPPPKQLSSQVCNWVLHPSSKSVTLFRFHSLQPSFLLSQTLANLGLTAIYRCVHLFAAVWHALVCFSVTQSCSVQDCEAMEFERNLSFWYQWENCISGDLFQMSCAMPSKHFNQKLMAFSCFSKMCWPAGDKQLW